jgi:hypothetical protein
MAWSNSYAITISHTAVSTATQTNFPMLFTGGYPALRTVANGGQVTSANGYDIIFASDSLGASPIPFERAAWNSKSGACEFWVQIASLSNTVDTTIYILFGNSAITTDQQSPATVWAAYRAVLHMATQTALSVTDSSGNGNGGVSGNGGVNLPTMTRTGIGAGTAVFATQGIYLPTFSFTTFSLACWIFPTALGGNVSMLTCSVDSSVEFDCRGGQLCLVLQFVAVMLAGSTVTANVWSHVACTYNSSTGAIQLFLNGVSAGTGTYSTTFATGHYIVGYSIHGENFVGSIDEFRISTSVYPAGWVATEYANQNSPHIFYSTSLALGSYNPSPWGPFPTAEVIPPPLVNTGKLAAHQTVKASAATALASGGGSHVYVS